MNWKVPVLYCQAVVADSAHAERCCFLYRRERLHTKKTENRVTMAR